MKKLVLLAVAAVSAVLIALPAAASAGEWQVDPAGWTFNATNVGNTTLTTSDNVTSSCTGNTGKGAYNAGSTVSGTIELTFTGCGESVFGTKCTTAGQPPGTVTTTANLTFTNVYLTDNKTTPGITIRGTGAEEHFASYVCGGGLGGEWKVTGTMLGHVESACNAESAEHKLSFESVPGAHGTQKFTKVTTTEAVEDLTAAVTSFGVTTNLTMSRDETLILKSQVAGQEAKITCV